MTFFKNIVIEWKRRQALKKGMTQNWINKHLPLEKR
jgi:hypothetical protein